MIESELAHGEMPPLHVHAADESFHIFEGSLTVYLGEDAVRLEAGETFVAPRGVPHTYRTESAKTRVLTMSRVESAARYDDFLRAVARCRGLALRSRARSCGEGAQETVSGVESQQ